MTRPPTIHPVSNSRSSHRCRRLISTPALILIAAFLCVDSVSAQGPGPGFDPGRDAAMRANQEAMQRAMNEGSGMSGSSNSSSPYGPGSGQGYGMGPGYGSGQGYGGNNPSGGMMQEAMGKLMAKLPLAALLGPPPRELTGGPTIMIDDATLAFKSGLINVATAHWLAQQCIDSSKMPSEEKSLAYCRALRRPVPLIRFGAAIAIRGDDVSTPSPLTADTRGSAAGSSGFGGSGFDPSSYQPDEFEYQGPDGQGMPRGGMPGGGSSMSYGPDGRPVAVTPDVPPPPPSLDESMTDDEPQATMNDNLGLVAERFAEQFASRFRAGQFGHALITQLPPAEVEQTDAERRQQMFAARSNTAATPTIGPQASSDLAELLSDIGETPISWQPGIDFLGELEADEALVKANADGLDFIFQFDVTLKETSGGPRGAGMRNGGGTDNISRVRLYDVRTGKMLYSTRSVSTEDAKRELARDTFEDATELVDDAARTFWNNFDRVINVVDMPDLSSENAVRRVGQILASPSRTILEDLAEVRLYGDRQWLTESQVQKAFAIIAGDPGLQLLYAAPEIQRQTARRLIAESFEINVEP